MDLRVCNVPTADSPSTTAHTFEGFASRSTASVEDVINKGRSFGFREVEIYFGSKKIPPEADTDQNTYVLDGKRFCFAGLQGTTMKQKTYKLIQKFFPMPILKQLGQPDNIKKEAAYSMIGKAFKYHDFIHESTGKFNPKKETFPDFLRRENEEHFTFLQKIVQGMKDVPNTKIKIKHNAYYLLAMWVELSNAMAPDFQSKDFLNWRDFEIAELQAGSNKRKKPLPDMHPPIKKIKLEAEIDASHSARHTTGLTPSDSGKSHNFLPDNQNETTRSQELSDMASTSSHFDAEVDQPESQKIKVPSEKCPLPGKNNSTDRATIDDTDDSTSDDTDVEACDNTSSHSATSNFVEKAKKEGRSKGEMAIQRINYLSQQVVNNLVLLKQAEAARNNQPIVSDSQKRQMVLTLNKGLTLINGLRASKK